MYSLCDDYIILCRCEYCLIFFNCGLVIQHALKHAMDLVKILCSTLFRCFFQPSKATQFGEPHPPHGEDVFQHWLAYLLSDHTISSIKSRARQDKCPFQTLDRENRFITSWDKQRRPYLTAHECHERANQSLSSDLLLPNRIAA